jgi:hypothetical protein
VTSESARCPFEPIEGIPEIEEEHPNIEEFQIRCAEIIGEAIAIGPQ